MATAQIEVKKAPDHVTVSAGGHPFTTFVFGADTGKPYLWPIYSGSGKMITRRWPMENVASDTHDHQHQRGLFFGYIDVNGFDFWGNETSYGHPKSGKISVERIADVKSGPDSGSIHAILDWLDPAGRKLLTEDRVMTFSAPGKDRVLDFNVTLQAATDVTFGDDKDGAFAIRLADVLNEKNTGHMTNAEGMTGMKDVWGKRSPWVDYSGSIDGEKLGIAMFDYPDNPGFPNRWHARDYGLFSLNPFADHAFVPQDPPKKTVLKPGERLHYRWRVVVHPGDLQQADVAKLYQNFAGAAKTTR